MVACGVHWPFPLSTPSYMYRFWQVHPRTVWMLVALTLTPSPKTISVAESKFVPAETVVPSFSVTP